MNLLLVEDLAEAQSAAVSGLQKLVFPNVSTQEAEEDFYAPELAHILAYMDGDLVGWVGLHVREISYEGEVIRLGGYGICAHPDWRRRGIASEMAGRAMDYLKEQGCQIAFLSIDPSDKVSERFHRNLGFVPLKQKFSWVSAKGQQREDIGGMIAPVNSRKHLDLILSRDSVFHVGEGYW